jgi:flagellar biosynthesis protein FliR
MSIDLGALFSGQIFAFMLIFARLGAAFMLMPGIGEPYVLSRARLGLALGTTLLLLPVLSPSLPAQPEDLAAVARLLFIEVTVGLFFGTILRFLMAALEEAGLIISIQAGLSNASVFNPALASQGTLPGAMLGAAAILLLFTTGLDKLLLGGLVATYELFKPGVSLPIADMSDTIAHLTAEMARIGFQIALPFVLIGLLTQVPLGLMNRMMPQLQVLTLAMPLQIGVGLLIFGLTISAMLLFWLERFEAILYEILR